MLARENRIIRAEDFRSTMKMGTRASTAHLVLHLQRVQGQTSARFGFVVAKTVGGAVQRNLVKRRLRSLSREALLGAFNDGNYVFRALPGAADLDWNRLSTEFQEAITLASRKASR